MNGHFHYDGQEFCETCLPVDENHPDVDLDQGEQDYIAHCCHCHRPLDCSLTSHGVDQVIESLAEALANEEWESREIRDVSHLTGEDYYKGLPHWAVLMDWAEHIESYGGLSQTQEGVLRAFLALFRQAQHNMKFEDRIDFTTYTYDFIFKDETGKDGVHTVSTQDRLDDYAAWALGHKLRGSRGWQSLSLIQESVVQTGFIKHALEGTLIHG